MGIKGLMSEILQKREQCMTKYDLVEEAKRSSSGIELLVDYYSFQLHLTSALWRSLSHKTGNKYLRLIGGEYQALDIYVTKFVKTLQALNIHLVWYADGSRGSSPQATERKIATWKSRYQESVKKVQALMDVCYGNRDIDSYPSQNFIRPVLLEVQFSEALRKCGCEIVQCPAGEADFIIAKDLGNRPRAFAIISNDSDFCVFPNVRFIPSDLFDLGNDLMGSLETDCKLEQILVQMITDSDVCSLLELSSADQLAELSIVAGNDFTSHVMWSLREHLGHGGCTRLRDAVSFVKEYDKVDNHPYIRQQLRQNTVLRNSIQASRLFYGLQTEIDKPHIKDPMSEHIIEAIRCGDYPPNFLGIHANTYWHRLLVEEVGNRYPVSEVAMSGLRTFVYRILLPRKEQTVNESGRSPWQPFYQTTMYAAAAHGIPTAHYINKQKIFPSLNLFHKILTHQEQDFDIKFFDRYGRKRGFTCYVLRYFLTLNTENNLFISYEEFMAAVAMMFYEHDNGREQWYQSLCIRPSARCVTLINWLQNVYRHAYLMLGKLLYLTHEFPTPQEVFCSTAVWTAFHATVQCRETGVHQFDRETYSRIRRDMDGVIKEKRHIVRCLTNGIYDSNY